MGNSEIRAAFVLKDRRRLRETYLAPALRDHLIEYTLPDQPNSRLQKYRLTAKGRALLAQLTSSARPPIVIVASHSAVDAEGVHAFLDPLGYCATRIVARPGRPAGAIGHDFIFRPAGVSLLRTIGSVPPRC